jgi:hypothetical protein
MNLRRQPPFGFVITALIVFQSLAWAEVGVVIVDDAQAGALFEQGIIVDDPDPVGSIWARFHTDTERLRVLNEDGVANADGQPSLLLNPGNRMAVVAWSKNSPSGYDIVVSFFSDGGWIEPVTLAGAPADELDPFLVNDPATGAVHLLYWVDDSQPRVMHRQAPADLSTWSAPVQVSPLGEVACRPSAVFHQGQLQVAFESHGSAYGSVPRQITLATESGGAYTFEVLATTVHEDPNWPQIHSANDRLWVDWIDDVEDMTWTRQQGQGPWEPVETQLFATPEERDYHVRGEIKAQALE